MKTKKTFFQGLCVQVGHFVPLKANVEEMHSEPCINQPQLWVLLDQVMDPMNVGTVLRTCHFLGIKKVILSSHW